MTKADKVKKIQESRLANKQKLASQTIQIDKDWKIIRLDEMNWQIKYRKNREPWNRWYYGTLYAAFKALPGKMIQAEAKSTLQEAFRSLEIILEKIDRVIPASRILI